MEEAVAEVVVEEAAAEEEEEQEQQEQGKNETGERNTNPSTQHRKRHAGNIRAARRRGSSAGRLWRREGLNPACEEGDGANRATKRTTIIARQRRRKPSGP